MVYEGVGHGGACLPAGKPLQLKVTFFCSGDAAVRLGRGPASDVRPFRTL
jgi:hypothetical protein